MKTLLDIIRTKSRNINFCLDDQQGTPNWNKLKKLIKQYYVENDINANKTNQRQCIKHIKTKSTI